MTKHLHIYDFDSTLYQTLTPDIGKPIYKEKTGLDWKGGWWGNRESLNIDIFDIELNKPIYDEYLKSKSKDNTNTYLVTGRITPLKNQVVRLLERDNIEFSDVFCCDHNNTLTFKINTFTQLISEHIDTLESVVIFDDRIEHHDVFVDFGKNIEAIHKIKVMVILVE